MRAWDAFAGLDSTVKNMVTSLRAVGELQNPAIRERHWQQLMQATQVCLYGRCVHEKMKLGQLRICGGSFITQLYTFTSVFDKPKCLSFPNTHKSKYYTWFVCRLPFSHGSIT